MLTPQQRLGEGRYHRNIRFVSNTIKSFNGLLAFARSVQGLTIAGNTMTSSKDYPQASEGPDIVLEYCDEVTIENNHAIGFKCPLAVTRSSDTARVEMKQNRGFKKLKQ